MDLLQRYADVQRDSNLTTMLHLDSTHSIVKQKYHVFVVGISDRSGGFLPVVYFCTSQRREVDISWCLAFMKRVMLREFDLQFSPDFIMMDADHAQYNACAAELQDSTILMCWFHIMQNVFKYVRNNKLAGVSAQLIFSNMYDLHFARSEQEFVQKREFVLRSWKAASALSTAFKRVVDHIIATWISSDRFSRWQAFHTPIGYAATNNPIETYHHTLKLVNDNKRATPTELITKLDLSRLAHVCSMAPFNDVPQVSKRLRAAYNRAEKRKELAADLVHRIQDRDLVLVRVSKQLIYTEPALAEVHATSGDAEEHACDVSAYESVNLTRKTWEGMPSGGWIVDATGRSCMCACWWKAGICLHVIKATKFAALPCPGMPPPDLRFQTPSQPRTLRNHTRRAPNPLPEVEPIPDGAIVFGPPTRAIARLHATAHDPIYPASLSIHRRVATVATVLPNPAPAPAPQTVHVASTHHIVDVSNNQDRTELEAVCIQDSALHDAKLRSDSHQRDNRAVDSAADSTRRSSRRRVLTVRAREYYALQKRRRTED